MDTTVNWLSYSFRVFNHGAKWNNVSGIYIFAGLNHQDQWVPYYIGQCDSFQNRISSHEQWDTAQSLGATHVHAKMVLLEEDRDLIERELIKAWQPKLNSQLR